MIQPYIGLVLIDSNKNHLYYLFHRYFIRLLLCLFVSQIQASPEQISIQLKWKHSFQFAGYYAAIEKGFYRDVGLDVTLKEIDFSKDFVQQVVNGESEYGVSDSTLLIYHLQGKPVVLLNQFFQHSPLVFLSLRDSGIVSPYEMVGKKVAFNVTNQGDASLNALLLNTLGDLSKVREVPFNALYYQDFMDGKIDVISGYSTSQPYHLKEQGVDVNIINPQSYGIDYYGDNLFTTQKELAEHPERVEKMSQATVKGWAYALEHPVEVIRLIAEKYATSTSESFLQYQASTIRQMVIPELIKLGSVDPKRYQQAAEDYQRLGFVDSKQIKNNFFYRVDSHKQIQGSVKLTTQEQAWIKSNPQVNVGGSPDWSPFNFADKNGQYSGIANDYLNLIAENTGLKFNVTIDQWNHNLEKIRNNQIDLLGSVYYTDARSKFLTFSKPYFEMLDYFFIRSDLKVRTLADLNGKRVAIPKNYAHEGLIKKHFPKIKIISVNTFSSAIDAVLENRADMLYDTYGALTYTLKKEGINTIIPFKSTRKLGKKFIHIASRKDLPELASIIQKGLDSISVKEKQEIYNKWLSKTPEVDQQAVRLSAAEQQWLRSHPEIRLGVDPSWPPYEFVDQSGELKGISADVINLLEKRLNIKFKLTSQNSWAETLDKARNHELDVLSSITKTSNREKYLRFTEPYFMPLNGIYTRKNNVNVTVTDLDDLKNKTVVIENQYFLHELLAKKYPDIKLFPVETTADALKAVSYGDVDAYVGNQGAANWVVEQNALNNLKITPATDIGQSPLRLAVRDDWPEFQSILDKTLLSISDVEMSTIRRKWLGLDFDNQGINKLTLNASEQQWLDEHKIIRFSGDPNWLPYEAFDKQGVYIGIVAEHLKLIEQRLGIKVDIIPTQSWSDSVAKVKQGDIDVISETSDSDLKSQLSFTQNYISSPVVIVMNKDENYVEGIDQIKHQKIAVIKEYGYVPQIIKKYPDLSFHRVDTIQEGLTAVSIGKVDALFATLAQASFHISELGINNIRIVGKTEFNTKLAFGMRQEFAPLAALFNRALSSISQNEKQVIFDAWGKHKYVDKIDYLLLIKIVALFLMIIAVIVYWNRKLAKEIALRKEIEAQTQALIDNIPLQVIVTSLQGHFITANPKALSDYKIHKSELDRFNISDFYVNPNDRELIVKELSEKGEVEQKIIVFKKRDGTQRSMMISVMPVFYQNQNAFLTIAVDMTERIEIESTLNEAREHADQANRAKSEFLTNMSHEIRTPMNAIIGFTELLNDQLEDPKLKSFVNTIQSAGNNLLTLINDILDLSKIEAGKFQIVKTACNPHELFTELGNIFMIKMAEKNIEFILDIDPLIPHSLQLDAPRLRQVLFNLIGNAVKFTEQGTIYIKARTDNEDNITSKLDLLIDIKDSGIGISEDQQPLIFQDFEQSSGQDLRKYGGTGLGLSISKKLVEMMGGQITLNSQLGKGSTFTVKLTGVNISSLVVDVDSEKQTPTTFISFPPCRILIVDDITDNRELLLALFAGTPIQTVETENGLEAVEQVKQNDAKQQPFDLILMDIRMPVMDGYQAAKEIKSFSSIPIVALTASVMTDEFETIRSNNFDGYLRKPVLKTDLFNELRLFLPFEELPIVENFIQSKPLSGSELRCLPYVLDELKKLMEQCNAISKSNNISQIQLFASTMIEITAKHPVTVVDDFAKRLLVEIDSFDIAAIKRSLNDFPKLISQLDQIKER